VGLSLFTKINKSYSLDNLMKQHLLTVLRIDGGAFLCPKCCDMDHELTVDDYYNCFYCGISGDSENIDIINIGYETPKFYKDTRGLI